MTTIKLNKILLDEIEDAKIKKTMKSIIDIKNCLVIYYFSTIFNFSNSVKVSMSIIERSFPMFADCDNFLELEFLSIKKILLSSGLNIDSELQVFNAADSWLCHDITERSKHAKDILCKVRLPLLSAAALKQILDQKQYLIEFNEFESIVKGFLFNKQQLNLIRCNTKTRYCT